jgi:rRNA processing protein Krr1/Pno1
VRRGQARIIGNGGRVEDAIEACGLALLLRGLLRRGPG